LRSTCSVDASLQRRACGTTWHLRSAPGSKAWGVQFALSFPLLDVTVFSRDSFGRNHLVQPASRTDRFDFAFAA
jgi:hypothetical protein